MSFSLQHYFASSFYIQRNWVFTKKNLNDKNKTNFFTKIVDFRVFCLYQAIFFTRKLYAPDVKVIHPHAEDNVKLWFDAWNNFNIIFQYPMSYFTYKSHAVSFNELTVKRYTRNVFTSFYVYFLTIVDMSFLEIYHHSQFNFMSYTFLPDPYQ